MVDFMLVYLDYLSFLAKKGREFTKTDYMILFYLLSKTKFGGSVSKPQKEIAKELKLQTFQVCTSISKLEKFGILSKKRNNFNNLVYTFNSDFIRVGKEK